MQQNRTDPTRACTYEHNRRDLHARGAGLTASSCGEVGKVHSAVIGPKWTQVGRAAEARQYANPVTCQSLSGAPGETRTPDPLLRSYAVQNSKCRCWCRLRGSASFISPLNWTEVGPNCLGFICRVFASASN